MVVVMVLRRVGGGGCYCCYGFGREDGRWWCTGQEQMSFGVATPMKPPELTSSLNLAAPNGAQSG
jgi:hypothetical protein